MGLFSNQCVQCGSRVNKNAEFCSTCGTPSATAWRKCFSCGAAVGSDSAHCWKCSANLRSQPAAELFSDRWGRSAGDFAVRFPLRMAEGVVKHGVQVDAGTLAILTVNGVIEDTLGPGYHVMSSFWERFSSLEKQGQHAEAIITHAEPATLQILLDGLHDAEQVPLGAKIHLEVKLARPDVFVRRAMVGRDRFNNDDISQLIGAEATEAARKRASQYRLEDLLADVSQRESLEAVLRPEMGRILEPLGLDLVQVRLARFSGPEVEALRARMGDHALKIRNYEIDRELHALERSHRFKGIQTEHEFNELEKQLSHDHGLKDAHRAKLRRLWDIESEREIRREQRGDELAELRHRTALTDAEEDTTDVRHQRQLQREQRELALANEARRRQLDELQRLKQIKLEQKRAETEIETGAITTRARALDGLSMEAIVAASSDATVGRNLVRLAEVSSGGALPGFFPASPGTPLRRGPGTNANPYAGISSFGLSAPSEDQQLQQVARNSMPAVGLITLTTREGDPTPLGTGWLVGPTVLATNAHVARDATEAVGAGASCWVTFGGGDGTRSARVERVLLHPKYGDPGPGPRGVKAAVPAYDLALFVLDQPQPVSLPLATPDTLMQLEPGTRVAYLGFPAEGLAGGGVNASDPAAVFKSGVIAQLTDWWLGQATFPRRHLIQHDLGVTGGASGSPLLNIHGHVIGILSAGNMNASVDAATGSVTRTPNGVLLNYAQRIDLLGELLAPSSAEEEFY